MNVLLEDASSGAGDLSGMKMTATPDTVKTGRVTIHATNQSEGLIHEVVVVRPPANGAPLPYDDKTGEVVEKQIRRLGEVSDLAAGKSGSADAPADPGGLPADLQSTEPLQCRDVDQADGHPVSRRP